MLVRRISLMEVSQELNCYSFSMYSQRTQGASSSTCEKVPKSQMRAFVDSGSSMELRFQSKLLPTSVNSLGYFLRIWQKLRTDQLIKCVLPDLQQELMLINRALLTSGSLNAILVRVFTAFLAISISTSEAQSLSSLSRSPRLYQLANSPSILTLMLLIQVGSQGLQQKYLKSFSKYCLPFMWTMTYSICSSTTNMVSQLPEFQLLVMRVIRGAFIFQTMVLQSYYFRQVSLRMILIEARTSGVEEDFSLSQRILIISYLSFSFSDSGVYLQSPSKMHVWFHSLYSFNLLIKQRYIFMLMGIPPSETKISSRARNAFTETSGSESFIRVDSELIRESSVRMVSGSTQNTLRSPIMAVFFTYGSKSLSNSRITGRVLLTQSDDLKEQRFLKARPLILGEVCLQSFLKVLTAIMAKSGLSSAYVVRQKQIIFFITSSLVNDALHIQEKTGEASMPRVMQLITFLITSLPFLLSFSLITPLRALGQGGLLLQLVHFSTLFLLEVVASFGVGY